MGSFILNYSDNRIKEANNMLEKFKKDVKYFALKKSNIFGNDLGIYKVKSVNEQKSCLTGGKNLIIHCIGIQVNGPRYTNNESEKYENTFIFGLHDFSFRLTRLTESNNEFVNMDGIVEMIDFFSEIDHIDEAKAKKCFENFKNELTKEMNKNLM